MNEQIIIGPNNDQHVLSLSETKKKISFSIFKTAPTNFISLRTADVFPRSSPLGRDSRNGPSGVERGETAVFAGYNFIWPKFWMSLQIPTYATPESKHAFLFSNDNRNLCKYIIDFIIKITNGFSNRVTSEHSTTLLKFIYIVWATPKRFFVTATWNNETKTKPKSPGDQKQKTASEENARPQKYCFRNVTALAEILSERIATVFF